MKLEIISKNADTTKELGELLAKFLFKGSVITLTGDLGAGKTTFASGVARGLGIEEKVNSPTFNIMKCYFSKPLSLYHIDAYRLNEGNKDLGLEEFIEGDGVCLIEWPNFIEELIDECVVLNIEINNLGGDIRKITLSSKNERYRPFLETLEDK